jgi:hypothetical protein
VTVLTKSTVNRQAGLADELEASEGCDCQKNAGPGFGILDSRLVWGTLVTEGGQVWSHPDAQLRKPREHGGERQ